MGGGHYCHNIELLEEVKDGPYKIRNILKNRGKMAFYVVYDESEPLIIAPIFAKITASLSLINGKFIPWKANNFTASSAFFSAKLFNSIAYSISSVSIFDV